jgi:hypothetical protein
MYVNSGYSGVEVDANHASRFISSDAQCGSFVARAMRPPSRFHGSKLPSTSWSKVGPTILATPHAERSGTSSAEWPEPHITTKVR